MASPRWCIWHEQDIDHFFGENMKNKLNTLKQGKMHESALRNGKNRSYTTNLILPHSNCWSWATHWNRRSPATPTYIKDILGRWLNSNISVPKLHIRVDYPVPPKEKHIDVLDFSLKHTDAPPPQLLDVTWSISPSNNHKYQLTHAQINLQWSTTASGKRRNHQQPMFIQQIEIFKWFDWLAA